MCPSSVQPLLDGLVSNRQGSSFPPFHLAVQEGLASLNLYDLKALDANP